MMEELVEEVVEETSEDDGTKQIEQQSSQCFEDEYEDDKDQIDIDDNFLVSLPDYIRNNEEVISENSQYVVLKGSNLGSNKKEVKIKKSTLLWFLINPERKLSSDRIQRVRDVKTNVSSSSGVKVRSNRTKKKTVTISETDTEDEESFKSGSSDDQWEEQHDDNDDDLESTNVLTNGDWILVKLPGKKCFKHFIGQILKINKSELTIKFCKKYSDNKFKWPEKEDIAVVNTIFSAELYAIWQALLFCLMSNTEESFAIVSDSQGALNSIKSRFPRDPLVQRIQAVYSNVVEVGKSIFWIWVPGHVGIRGNVMADEAAKRATGVRHVDVQVVRHLDLKAALRAALVHPKPWRPPLYFSVGLSE
ncbi:uncharacterized protein LOC116169068 [Photinus pyralis]|uniref:uncharacterized protein LOC116169068 n=1 Tax=Photinus pyralis TaxID=7054 RepID=UPI0012677B8B|nr:uncharacterized protein LOC116169068 [Photinus pyralis]